MSGSSESIRYASMAALLNLRTSSKISSSGPIAVTALRAWTSLTVTTFVQFFDAATTTDVTLGTTVPDWIIAVSEISLTDPNVTGISDPDGFPTTGRGLVFQKGLCAAATTHQSNSTTAEVNLSVCIS